CTPRVAGRIGCAACDDGGIGYAGSLAPAFRAGAYLRACLTRSSATAVTIIAPVTISCTQFGNPTCVQPVRMTVMRKAPINDPAIVPSPPDSDPPQITTAAITSSSSPTESVGSPTVSVLNSRIPASPASAPAIV